MNSAAVFTLHVAKAERFTNPITNEPAARDAAAGITGGNTSSALNEVKPRLAVDDAGIGSPAHEHREAIEVLDEMSHCHWIENEWRECNELSAPTRAAPGRAKSRRAYLGTCLSGNR